jgi:cellulose synthase (UDP-forming)
MKIKPTSTESDTIIKANAPTKQEKFTIRFLILLGLICMVVFLTWFFTFANPGYPLLYYPLTFALLFKILRILHEWYHYANLSVPEKPELKNQFTVDMLTTACPGEPYEMFEKTLKAMVEVKYPHTSYLCDEGDDPKLKALCEELGVIHVTRTEKIDAKAGNINNALKQATGEICVVLDPDHVPHPAFLDRVLPYFEDPKMGYVQVVQAYGNQNESLIALGAAQQTYTFYGPMMMSMNSYGTVQAIGANCTFRRAALDSIGGHAAGLSEDMHTAMQIHAKGWKSVYVPEVLSRGYVPSSLPAYYKQQLKWSRGTFDLFFKVFWKLQDKFSLKQKIHYFMLPLYFLFGLISMIDLAIPILALVLCHTPWEVNLSDFAVMYLPLIFLNLLIRQYAQRWLLEEHERGLHITGGILRIGTWWIFLLGFIYTLFNIKVPYIPTPKDDEHQNNWKLCIPNLVVCLITIVAIFYGVSIDSSPYGAFMAGFGLTNVTILLIVTVMAQEKFLMELSQKIKDSIIYQPYILPFLQNVTITKRYAYAALRRSSLILAIIIVAGLYSFKATTGNSRVDLKSLAPPDMKETGGFYTGIYSPDFDENLHAEVIAKNEKLFDDRADIISFYQAWGPESIKKFPMEELQAISKRGSIAMINWEPWPQAFPEFEYHPELSEGIKTCQFIAKGYFDDYLKAYAQKLKEYGEPVFIRFAHEPDNTVYPWSKGGHNTPNEYIYAYRHVVSLFKEEGVFNVAWVYNVMKKEALYKYFPGGEYVDWIGVTLLNYGEAGPDKKWYSFSELYEPYREQLLLFQRPVMIAEFGSTPFGGDKQKWVIDGLNSIKNKYPEIKSVVFFNTNKDRHWITDWRPDKKTKYIDWTIENPNNQLKNILAQHPFNHHPFSSPNQPNARLKLAEPHTAYESKFFTGYEGSYELLIKGEPYYIKGVAYNTGHDWRDGNMPLTRRQVSKDLKLIKEMGANTIRRYAPGMYDRNILNEAKKQDLNVIYGFWFDPEIDYYRDTVQVIKYLKELQNKVRSYKNRDEIIMWAVGNETWGLLKHSYCKPYLTKVRSQYLAMIENMTQYIHEADPSRPVMSTSEHEVHQLPGEIVSYKKFVPSLDIYSVNSYYEEQISSLNELILKFDPDRPYLIAEFGPKGYWLPEFTTMIGKRYVEDSDYDNAALYQREWEDFILKNKGNNVGGIAYCWRDRMEGTFTWYGITDYKNRRKPVYYTLQSLWNEVESKTPIPDYTITSYYNKLKPGKNHIFKVNGKPDPKIKFEWMLQKDEYLGEVTALKTTADGRIAIINLPDKDADYRLYLFAYDDQGNVVSASEPINIKKAD